MNTTVFNKEEYKAYVNIEMTLVTCTCGIPYMIPTKLQREIKAEKKTFYCPLGHSLVYRTSTEEDLKEKFEKERERADEEINRLKRERNDWQDLWNKKVIENKKLVAKKKRDEKRIHAGVCTCCNRTFQNLKRHMETKHSK